MKCLQPVFSLRNYLDKEPNNIPMFRSIIHVFLAKFHHEIKHKEKCEACPQEKIPNSVSEWLHGLGESAGWSWFSRENSSFIRAKKLLHKV